MPLNNKKPTFPKPDLSPVMGVEFSMWGWDYTRYNRVMEFVDESFIRVFSTGDQEVFPSLIKALELLRIQFSSLCKKNTLATDLQTVLDLLGPLRLMPWKELKMEDPSKYQENIGKAYQLLLTIKTRLGLSGRIQDDSARFERDVVLEWVKARVCS